MIDKLLKLVNKKRIRRRYARFRYDVDGLIDRAYFKESKGTGKEKRKIFFYSVVWGEEFLDSFFSYTVPSLLQDGNIPELVRDGYDLRFTIYTNIQQYQKVADRFGPCLARLNEYASVHVISFDELEVGRWRGDYWQDITSANIDQFKVCLSEDAILFASPPDTIFGNSSITNAVRIVRGKNMCLAAAHPRVDKGNIQKSAVFAELKRMERVIENDELVDLAFEYGHSSLIGSFDNEDSNLTRYGVSIRKINVNSYSVIHNTPMVWLADLNYDDLKFFEAVGPYWDDRWDHRWARLLLRQNRLKYVGSSDLFFCIDSTLDEERENPRKAGFLNNDKFRTRRERYLHNYVFNSFCSVWRGRGDDRSWASTEPNST